MAGQHAEQCPRAVQPLPLKPPLPRGPGPTSESLPAGPGSRLQTLTVQAGWRVLGVTKGTAAHRRGAQGGRGRLGFTSGSSPRLPGLPPTSDVPREWTEGQDRDLPPEFF